MKSFYLISLLFVLPFSYADELKWVNEQVEAIKPPRVGLNKKELSLLKNPFVSIEKTKKVQKKHKTKKAPRYKSFHKDIKLQLTLIINKTAQINGRWYKEGEEIYKYKIIKISPNAVLLKKRQKELILTTNTRNTNLKFR